MKRSTGYSRMVPGRLKGEGRLHVDVGRFRRDLQTLAHRSCRDDDEAVRSKVFGIVGVLVNLYRKNLVKINHSALELVCARSLIAKGYDTTVEHRLDKALVCDVYGTRGDGALVVEIETGFIPPEAALQPASYAKTRIASKIARYSSFAARFALGTTPTYVLDFPSFFVAPPKMRSAEEARRLKSLTDVYYDKPSISVEELLSAKLHSVFIIDVDTGTAGECDPAAYLQGVSAYARHSGGSQGLNPNQDAPE